MTETAIKPWAGRAVTAARVYMSAKLPAPCGKCGNPVLPDRPGTPAKYSSWVVGHRKDRAIHPELTWEPSNWQPEHRACSNASGQATVVAKAKLEALVAAGITDEDTLTRILAGGSPHFPGGGGARK